MKITFYSNFLNHHQLPFCEEMIKILGKNFKFVATEKIPLERLQLGYEDMNDKYEFVIKAYEDEKKAIELAEESDVIILGSAPTKYIRIRKKYNKLCFRYSERVFRNEKLTFDFFKHYLSIIIKKTFIEKKIYMLCASAFTARDYNIAGAYINKCYKWGYFTEVKKYKNIDEIINSKEENSILWVARFIKVKHPEIVINLALKLKEQNKKFNIKMIGIGPLKKDIENMIKENKLENCITLYDSMSPQEIRKYMEKSQIYLFTSDKGEGWGAVLNEAMNSGCAVIANSQIGSVPFLIENNTNGLIYDTEEELFRKVQYLLKNNKITKKMGENAYFTMLNEWSPKIAAERIVKLSSMILEKKDISNLYDSGPCSKAFPLKDNWYSKEKGD